MKGKLLTMDHPARLRHLQPAIQEHRLDALLVTHLPNVRYLCGFTGSSGALIMAGEKIAFVTDGRYAAQAAADVKGAKVVISKKGPLAAAADWLSGLRRKGTWRVGIEAERLTVAERQRLVALLPSGIKPKNAPPMVEQARMVKDADEIARMRAAAKLGGKLFDLALTVIRPGIKESEVAAEMEYAARLAGAEEMSFPTIIAAGKRSALPHGRASGTRVPSRGFVVCDFGVILAGYCSDMTRTVHVGRPSRDALRNYLAVLAAQQAAVEAVRPGIRVGEVDTAARKVLQQCGLAKYFTHSTGHGVGLEIHEAPRVAAGLEDVLRPGMVITIEPGAYVPGKWGVRIEDMVLVTERGHEVLTLTGKDLITIG